MFGYHSFFGIPHTVRQVGPLPPWLSCWYYHIAVQQCLCRTSHRIPQDTNHPLESTHSLEERKHNKYSGYMMFILHLIGWIWRIGWLRWGTRGVTCHIDPPPHENTTKHWWCVVMLIICNSNGDGTMVINNIIKFVQFFSWWETTVFVGNSFAVCIKFFRNVFLVEIYFINGKLSTPFLGAMPSYMYDMCFCLRSSWGMQYIARFSTTKSGCSVIFYVRNKDRHCASVFVTYGKKTPYKNDIFICSTRTWLGTN